MSGDKGVAGRCEGTSMRTKWVREDAEETRPAVYMEDSESTRREMEWSDDVASGNVTEA